MTNEELAVRAGRGNRAAIEELWQAVEPFVWKEARYFCDVFRADCAVTTDDLVQSGYFALVKAAKSYEPKGKSFLGWLRWYLVAEFCSVRGYSRTRHAYDPTRTTKSLDAPLAVDSDLTMVELLGDPDAPQAMEQAEDRVLLSTARSLLDRELDKLPGRRSAILRLRYYDGLSLQQTADRLGITRQRAQQLEQDALCRLRESEQLISLCALFQYPQPVPKKPRKK